MTILILLVLLGAAAVAALLRDLRRDPARSIPGSHADAFAPRWADAGTGRWSL
ncbi:MAG: hypothetical protein LCI03_02260 [Actinobacteria bacterium]|jgi:hypothetical protein|nr:hypothetical protein [Actinomycetota bacterium]